METTAKLLITWSFITCRWQLRALGTGPRLKLLKYEGKFRKRRGLLSNLLWIVDDETIFL